jgi:hypothetical protein
MAIDTVALDREEGFARPIERLSIAMPVMPSGSVPERAPGHGRDHVLRRPKPAHDVSPSKALRNSA